VFALSSRPSLVQVSNLKRPDLLSLLRESKFQSCPVSFNHSKFHDVQDSRQILRRSSWSILLLFVSVQALSFVFQFNVSTCHYELRRPKSLCQLGNVALFAISPMKWYQLRVVKFISLMIFLSQFVHLLCLMLMQLRYFLVRKFVPTLRLARRL
jgi:hypothetical protein